MSLLILSDYPPLGNEGIAMSVLSHRIIQAVASDATGVVTRRYSRRYPRHRIGQNLNLPTFIAWDCTSFGLKFLRRNLRYKADDFLQTAWLRFHRRRFTAVREVLGLSGPNWHFLKTLADHARLLNCSYSVYVVDDYEETSEKLRLEPPGFVHQRVHHYLHAARRVFAICPGMAERLAEAYQIKATIVYPVADQFEATSSSPSTPERVVYVGSLGPTYLPQLTECAALLERLNANGAHWELHILSTDQKTFQEHLARYSCARLRWNLPREELRTAVSTAEVIFVPYTFASEFATTARTSFPSKFMDAVVSRRPVLVHAPPYASIVRHLRDNNCPYVAANSADLETLFRERPWQRDTQWQQQYELLHQRYHSLAAARQVLLGPSVPSKSSPC